MSIYGWFKGKGPTGFGYQSTAEQVTEGLNLSGQVVLVTGCNSGLGQETARVLALRGARVVGLARTEAKATAALAELPGQGHLPVACELSELESVKAAISAVAGAGLALNALIANAGIMALPKLEQVHGYELQFFTNHVGHALLIKGLLPTLAPGGRVVILSSSAHSMAPADVVKLDNLSGERDYSAWPAYGQSKLANLLFARELSRRLEGHPVNAVHPGVIPTNLGRHMPGLAGAVFALAQPFVLKTIPQGAATQCYLAVHPDAAAVTGEYWADCNVAQSSALGQDAALAKRLWEETDKILAEVAGWR